jgi:hypothetical protein
LTLFPPKQFSGWRPVSLCPQGLNLEVPEMMPPRFAARKCDTIAANHPLHRLLASASPAKSCFFVCYFRDREFCGARPPDSVAARLTVPHLQIYATINDYVKRNTADGAGTPKQPGDHESRIVSAGGGYPAQINLHSGGID